MTEEQFYRCMVQTDADFNTALFEFKRRGLHTHVPIEYILRFNEITDSWFGKPFSIKNMVELTSQLKGLWQELKCKMLSTSFPIFPIGAPSHRWVIHEDGDIDYNPSDMELLECQCIMRG